MATISKLWNQTTPYYAFCICVQKRSLFHQEYHLISNSRFERYYVDLPDEILIRVLQNAN